MLLGKFTYTNISVFMMPKNVGPYSDAFCNNNNSSNNISNTSENRKSNILNPIEPNSAQGKSSDVGAVARGCFARLRAPVCRQGFPKASMYPIIRSPLRGI